MRPSHLVRRFVGALWPVPPRSEDEAWAAEVLAPEELLLYRRLPNHDRRHALRVAHRAETALGADAESRWIAAAMLHDVGKYDAGLSVPGRAFATVFAAGRAGTTRVARWEQRPGWRRHVALYARHGELGAEQIRRAGGREEAAVWSAAHHHPETFDRLPLPPAVVHILDAADQ
jgi:HD domain